MNNSRNLIEIATGPFKEGVREGAAAFTRDVKAQWKPYLPLFLAFGLGVALARFTQRELTESEND
jgi:hypothetical protein